MPADPRPLRRAQPGAARGGKGVLYTDVALPAFAAARPAYSPRAGPSRTTHEICRLTVLVFPRR